jgi:hypothetical protein
MKKTLIIVLTLMTGCVYSPRDDHSTHYHSPNDLGKKQETSKKKKLADEDYVQQYSQVDPQSNDAPFYNGGFDRVETYSAVRPNPHYTPIPHPVNRTIYFVESRY